MKSFFVITILGMLIPNIVLASDVGVEPRLGEHFGSATKTFHSVGAYKWMTDKDGDASGTQIENFSVAVRRTGVELSENSGPFTLKNGEFSLIAPTSSPNLPVSVSLIKAHDVLVENVFAHGFKMLPGEKKYINGDGFSSEKTAINITFRKTRSEDNSDGGYDMKAMNVFFDRTSAARNGKNYRVWLHDARGTTMTSINPRSEHIELNSGVDKDSGRLMAASLTIELLKIVDNVARPIANLGKGTSLTVLRCDITMPQSNLPMVRYHDGGSSSNTKVSLGVGCKR